MGYICDLGKRIVNGPLITPSASVLLLNQKGQLLLKKRADNHNWGYPGGALERHENFEQCVQRALFADTGLKCLELIEFAHNADQKLFNFYPSRDKVHIIEMVFFCDRYEGVLRKQTPEEEELRFFDLDDLPERIYSFNRGVIKTLVKQTKFF